MKTALTRNNRNEEIDDNSDKADDERSIELAARRCRADKTIHRMRSVLAFSDVLSRRALFSLIGRQWNASLDLSQCASELRELAEVASHMEADAMMTEEECELRDDLPPDFFAYRGCYRPDVCGLRWSLEPRTASKYPFLPHLRQERSPLLAQASVRRVDCVVKLKSDEIEIVIWKPKVVSVEQLPPLTH